MMMVDDDDYDSESLLHNLLLIISVESGHDDMIYVYAAMIAWKLGNRCLEKSDKAFTYYQIISSL
jgi:hypothetical protein